MSELKPAKCIWMDGALVPWEEAQVHVLTQSLHYGWAVYEGIRAHSTGAGPAVFRLPDHLARLRDSARVYLMDLPYDADELAHAVVELIRANGTGPRYVRPLVYLDHGSMGIALDLSRVRVAIAAWEWEAAPPPSGWRLMTSGWRRNRHDAIPPFAKATGAYLNSSLCKLAAVRAGYDDGLQLTGAGCIAECSAANFFLVKNGVLHTPAVSEGILPGITRDTVLRLARHAGIETAERPIAHTEAYTADEAFVTGTSIGVVPIASVDDRPTTAGIHGPVTELLRSGYQDAVTGQQGGGEGWLTPV
ncbi:branched-chain amino acid transaminase [Streptomyces sp. NPDC059002]|uniref:branched-chain amino acid transaminase n=1 Tax=Streptomyces sp. NPDC059002 TaxID=3346690 RepID=UPI0036C98125